MTKKQIKYLKGLDDKDLVSLLVYLLIKNQDNGFDWAGAIEFIDTFLDLSYLDSLIEKGKRLDS
jgi:hypothetical protein